MFRLVPPLLVPIQNHVRTLIFPPNEDDFRNYPEHLQVKRLLFEPSSHQSITDQWGRFEVIILSVLHPNKLLDSKVSNNDKSSSFGVFSSLPEPFMVTFVDANHCPGANLAFIETFPFRGVDLNTIRITSKTTFSLDTDPGPLTHPSHLHFEDHGPIFLHTGDMRFHVGMKGLFQPFPLGNVSEGDFTLGSPGEYPYPSSLRQPRLGKQLAHIYNPPPRISGVYLDNTYCSSGISFPPQKDSISSVLEILSRELNEEKSKKMLLHGTTYLGKTGRNDKLYDRGVVLGQSEIIELSDDENDDHTQYTLQASQTSQDKEVYKTQDQEVHETQDLEVYETQDNPKLLDIEQYEHGYLNGNETIASSLPISHAPSNASVDPTPSKEFQMEDPLLCGFSVSQQPLSFLENGQTESKWSVRKRPSNASLQPFASFKRGRTDDSSDKPRNIPPTLVLIGSYAIGKEKILIQLYKKYKLPIFASQARLDKLRVVCQSSIMDELISANETSGNGQLSRLLLADEIFTRSQSKSRIHVVPMNYIGSTEAIAQYLFSVPNYIDDENIQAFPYSKVLIIRPTGWCGTDNKKTFRRISVSTRREPTLKRWVDVETHSVPYSEHSSYSELQEFLALFRPNNSQNYDNTVSTTSPPPFYQPLIVGTVRGRVWKPSTGDNAEKNGYNSLQTLVKNSLPGADIA